MIFKKLFGGSRCFKFEGVNLVDALRDFLESFRLSGEAPVISRIMELFAAYWLDSNKGGHGNLFYNQDAVYVLSYAIMMLNTDLHSARIKQRMSLEVSSNNQKPLIHWPDVQTFGPPASSPYTFVHCYVGLALA